MSDIEKLLAFPLDEDCFFRRECPFCIKEFKVLVTKEELTDLSQKGIDSFMLDQEEEYNKESEEDFSEKEFFCPYCGQSSSIDSWWTKEQLAYIQMVVENIMANLLNENLIKPLKRDINKPNSPLRFEGKLLEQHEHWISHEKNDMKIIELPCCQRNIKIEDDWNKEIYCFFCGFPHNQ